MALFPITCPFTKSWKGFTLAVVMSRSKSSSIRAARSHQSSSYQPKTSTKSSASLSSKKKKKGESGSKKATTSSTATTSTSKEVESGPKILEYLSDKRDHSRRYVGKDYSILYPTLSRFYYGPFPKYSLAYELLVEMFGDDDLVPEEIEIDIVEPRVVKKLRSPEQFETDLKIMWGVLTND